MERYIVSRGTGFQGTTIVPGDKSVSHRALMLGAIAEGETTVSGFLDGADCLATLAAMRDMGATIERSGEHVRILGRGRAGLNTPLDVLDLGNSGTSCRLLAGLLVGQRVRATLTGDASLRSRPMERVAGPLRKMGASIATTDGRAPILIEPVSALAGIETKLDVASAQLKSALLLAGLGADGRTTVHSPGVSRDHTERMLAAMGVEIHSEADGSIVSVDGPVVLMGTDIEVPGDLSSAAFFLVAAAIGATGPVTLRGVGINPTRDGVLRILKAMGARLTIENRRTCGAEPVADLTVTSGVLRGIDIPPEWVPLAIDEIPVICVAAAAASGRTRISEASELRHKESDRISAMADALRAVGVAVSERPDGLEIDGGVLSGGVIMAHDDHRIAMSMAVAALAASEPLEIRNTENVITSFPGFVDTARQLGLQIAVEKTQAA